MKAIAESRIKRARAVELAAQGWSYDEIASAVGYSHRGPAHRAVLEAISEHEAEEVELLRALELVRLDYLLTKLWPRSKYATSRRSRSRSGSVTPGSSYWVSAV